MYEPGGWVGGWLQPLRLGQNHHFRAKANFFGRSQQPEMKKILFLYLLNEKNGIHSG